MNKNLFFLVLSTIIISIAPLFAKIITLGSEEIIWWRCFIAAFFLGIILFLRKSIKIPFSSILSHVISGVFLGLHWWTYFLSIQLSSVSIGVLTLFTYPLITSIMEPLILKKPMSKFQIIGGFGILLGVIILVPDFSFGNSLALSVFFGLMSAVFFSSRGIITKIYLSTIPSMTILFYQLVVAFVSLSLIFIPFSLIHFSIPSNSDFALLVLLSLVFTIVGHGLMTYSLKFFSASTVAITGSLQVVLSTVFAFLILSEIPENRFYPGATIIVTIVIFELYSKKKAITSHR